MRAMEQGVKTLMLPAVVLKRRIHATNHGIVRRDTRQDYVRVLKIKRDPKCPVCSDHPTQTGLIDYEAFCGLAAAPSAGAAAANGHAEAAPAGR